MLLISTMVFPDVAEHLDTGGLLAITGPAEGRAFAAEGERPHLELVLRALNAARERERAEG